MTFNKQLSQGRGAILSWAYGGAVQLSRVVYAVIVSDAWDPTDYTGSANMSAAEANVAAYLWDGTTDGGGNFTDDPVTVTVSSVTASDGAVTVIIGDVAFGNCSALGGTVYGDPGWIVFFVEKATAVTDADRYIIGVADFDFTPVVGQTVTWVSDNTGTFIDEF